MKPRIIVCGLGRTGYKIFCLLKQQGALVVGISNQPMANESEQVVVGDLSAGATLIAAGINEAHTLVISTHDDALNLAILMQARILNPKINIINRLFNTSLGDHNSLLVKAIAQQQFIATFLTKLGFCGVGVQTVGVKTLTHRFDSLTLILRGLNLGWISFL